MGRALVTFSFRTSFRGAKTRSHLPVATGDKRLKDRAKRERKAKGHVFLDKSKNLNGSLLGRVKGRKSCQRNNALIQLWTARRKEFQTALYSDVSSGPPKFQK